MRHFGVWDLWVGPMTLKSELGRYFCTMHQAIKFRYPTFNHLEVIVLTNKHVHRQSDATENIHFASLGYTNGNK